MKSNIYLCQEHYEEFKRNFDKGPLGLEMKVEENPKWGPNFPYDCEASNILDKECMKAAKYRIRVDLSKIPKHSPTL
jgi:hypothetical protein